MPDVSIAPCRSYEPGEVRQALEQVLAPIGGLDFVRPGMRVAIKANLVVFRKPEAAATTHPEMLCGLIDLLRERGAEVTVGDSPGGLYNAAYVGRVYAATGMHAVEQHGAQLNHDFSQRTVRFPEARVAKEFLYTAWLDKADAIIDFCKLKTHGMMGMSAAAKNMFGVIPGTVKPEYHFRYPDARDFARMIVDLDEFCRPVLCIADAVVGMEGNGPTQGTPRPIGCVAASKSPHLLDLACAELIGLRRCDVPTLEAARERGLIPDSWEQLDITGDLAAFRVPDFEKLEVLNSTLFKNENGGFFARLSGKVVQASVGQKPKLDAKDCVGCGECGRICPAKAITMTGGRPEIDRKKCIRCFCCQEFCPKGAMKVARPLVARLLNRGAG